MDLLGGYGSGDESGDDEKQIQPEPARRGVLSSLPAPSSLGRKADGPAAGPSRPPAAADKRAEADDLGTSTLTAKLPAPRKRVIQFAVPIDKAVLNSDSDEDYQEEQRQKRAKAAGAKGKSNLMDFLPAPKSSSGAVSGLGGASALGRPRSGLPSDFFAGASAKGDVESDEDPVAKLGRGDVGAAGPSDDGEGRLEAAGNEAYRVGDGTVHGASTSGWEHAHAHGQHHHSDYASHQESWQQQPPQQQRGQGHEADLFAQALAAEAEKAARRGGGNVPTNIQFKEINQQELTYINPAQKETAAGIQGALGTEYALKMRAEAAPYAGSKLAKRKHQIGTLYHQAKVKELEILEGKVNGMKHKSETKAKYGW